MGVFEGDDHKFVENKHFTNYLFQMEDDKICEVGHFLDFHFKHFLVD
jgi:hypothetical protein